jgi:hypothetical protein
MEMDRPHIEKTSRYYNRTSSVLEPVGYEKKRIPKNARRRDLDKDRSNIGKNVRDLEILTKDRRA